MAKDDIVHENLEGVGSGIIAALCGKEGTVVATDTVTGDVGFGSTEEEADQNLEDNRK